MTAPQFFGALVRAIGVYWLAHGLTYLAAALFPMQGYTPMSYVFIGAAEMIVGAFLMFKADGMVESCYSLGALSLSSPAEKPAQPPGES